MRCLLHHSDRQLLRWDDNAASTQKFSLPGFTSSIVCRSCARYFGFFKTGLPGPRSGLSDSVPCCKAWPMRAHRTPARAPSAAASGRRIGCGVSGPRIVAGDAASQAGQTRTRGAWDLGRLGLGQTRTSGAHAARPVPSRHALCAQRTRQGSVHTAQSAYRENKRAAGRSESGSASRGRRSGRGPAPTGVPGRTRAVCAPLQPRGHGRAAVPPAPPGPGRRGSIRVRNGARP